MSTLEEHKLGDMQTQETRRSPSEVQRWGTAVQEKRTISKPLRLAGTRSRLVWPEITAIDNWWSGVAGPDADRAPWKFGFNYYSVKPWEGFSRNTKDFLLFSRNVRVECFTFWLEFCNLLNTACFFPHVGRLLVCFCGLGRCATSPSLGRVALYSRVLWGPAVPSLCSPEPGAPRGFSTQCTGPSHILQFHQK